VHNSTHLEVDFQSDNLGGQIIDAVMLTKSPGAHCNFGSACKRSAGANGTSSALAGRQSETGAAAAYHTAAARAAAVERLRRCWRSDGQACGLQAAAAGPGALRHGGDSNMAAVVNSNANARRNPTDAKNPPVPDAQRQALIGLYHSLGGANWTYRMNWLAGDPCDAERPWYGVSCQKVTDTTLPDLGAGAPYGVSVVQLPTNNLRGDMGPLQEELPCALGPSLQLLDLSYNSLWGELSPALVRMPRLHSLLLGGTGVAAAAPRDASAAGNESGAGAGGGGTMRISGQLSDPACTSNLKYLFIERQGLTGSLPSSIGDNCTGLRQIWLWHNSLSGLIPQVRMPTLNTSTLLRAATKQLLQRSL
jgi:hypothetical protein